MSTLDLDLHKQRKALGLSLNQMAVLVEIHNSIIQDQWQGEYSTIPKRVFAERLDLSQKSIFNILNSLEAFGYIERIGENGYIKVTDKAYNTK